MGLQSIMKKVIKVYTFFMVVMAVVDISFTMSFLSSPVTAVYVEGIQNIVANIVLLLMVSILIKSTNHFPIGIKRTVVHVLLLFTLVFLLYFIHSYGITVTDNRVITVEWMKTIYLKNSLQMLLLMVYTVLLMVGTIIENLLLIAQSCKKNA